MRAEIYQPFVYLSESNFKKLDCKILLKKKRIEIRNQIKIIVYIKLKLVTLLLLINNNL